MMVKFSVRISRPPSLLVILVWMAYTMLITQVTSDGKLQFRLVHYDNPTGKNAEGRCCDGRLMFCETRGCDHYFKVCVDDSVRSDTDISDCSIAHWTTGTTLNHDSIAFGTSVGGTVNPVDFNFTHWNSDGVNIKIEVWDEDSGRPKDDFVDQLRDSLTLLPAATEDTASWTSLTFTSRTSLTLEIKVFCQANWYGPHCDVFCAPPGGSHAHYTCDITTGSKRCVPGEHCTVVGLDVCQSNPCHGSSSRCENLGTGYRCHCSSGLAGQRCEIPDAEVTCGDGVRCFERGGVCNWNAERGYSCQCRLGWTGSACETESTHAIDAHVTGSQMTCVCQDGETCVNDENGTRCRKSTVGACSLIGSASPCQNGGTCVSRPSFTGYQCLCTGTWSGDRCQTLNNPCENGQKCPNKAICIQDTHSVNGYRCVCDPQWTGVDCGLSVANDDEIGRAIRSSLSPPSSSTVTEKTTGSSSTSSSPRRPSSSRPVTSQSLVTSAGRTVRVKSAERNNSELNQHGCINNESCILVDQQLDEQQLQQLTELRINCSCQIDSRANITRKVRCKIDTKSEIDDGQSNPCESKNFNWIGAQANEITTTPGGESTNDTTTTAPPLVNKRHDSHDPGVASALVFMGSLEKHDTEHLVSSIINRTADEYRLSIDDVTVNYDIQQCQTSIGTEISLFFFHVLCNGSTLTWEAIDLLFSSMTSESFEALLPLPVSNVSQCGMRRMRVSSPDFHGNVTVRTIIHHHWMPLVATVIFVTTAIVMVTVYAKLSRRKRCTRGEPGPPELVGGNVEAPTEPSISAGPVANGDYDVPRRSQRIFVVHREADHRSSVRWPSSSSSSAGHVPHATTITSAAYSTVIGRHRCDSSPSTASPVNSPYGDSRLPSRTGVRIHVGLTLLGTNGDGSIDEGCLADGSQADSVDEFQHTYDELPK